MPRNTKKFKFPAASDKFCEGISTKTQWLVDYYSFREHMNDEEYTHISPQQFQSSLGQNCSLLANRFRGSMLGLAAGDALGTTLEFQKRPASTVVTDIVGGGPFNLDEGQWTDDTSMALCLAHSLLRRRSFDPKDQMELYVSWWQEGAFSSTGKCFDIGGATRASLEKFKKTGNPLAGSKSPSKAGNGSLMRLAPIVLFFASDPDDALQFAAESSVTTHAAEEAVDACRLFAAILLGALLGEKKEQILSSHYAPVKRYWHYYSLSEKINAIAKGSYKNKTRDEIKSSGYVVESLEAALWAFYNSKSFEDGAILAVNLGGDSDTVGAIYGQLAGAYYGETAIPIKWIKKLSYNHVFFLFADELVSFYSGRPIFN
ncbi:ADP-ribosylglycohydrolase family protein [hydrothermal vent metagenome]|uniref:ADP-ribosylglycohydrolase family protein n=1 Tax=hydrothermal vent metagenome TaxID=652676 RepID=A0A3B0Z520_9ZZZZ